jgi:hypothetical protein
VLGEIDCTVTRMLIERAIWWQIHANRDIHGKKAVEVWIFPGTRSEARSGACSISAEDIRRNLHRGKTGDLHLQDLT